MVNNMTTDNDTIGTTWGLVVSGPQPTIATISSKITDFEIGIFTALPAETILGFVVPARAGYTFTLESGENLYGRSLTGQNPVQINT